MHVNIPEISEELYKEQLALTEKYAPENLPIEWRRLPSSMAALAGQFVYTRVGDGLLVIFTADNMEGDGKTWLHVSMSRRSRMPTYDDMTRVKEVFIGRDRKAIQIFAKESKHINLHPYCLHLWAPIEGFGDSIPDFGKYGTI